jgi:PAS domain S-box-containing protein
MVVTVEPKTPSLQKLVKELADGPKYITKIRDLNEQLSNELIVDLDDVIELWNNSSDLMSVHTLNGRFITVNQAWSRWLGWSREELVGNSVYDLIHLEDQSLTKESLGKLGDHNDVRFRNRYLAKSGEYACLDWTVTQRGTKRFSTARVIPLACLSCAEMREFSYEVEGHAAKS